MGAIRLEGPDVPGAVRVWLEAHAAKDLDREESALCEDVVVAARGRLFLGRAAAREWYRRTAGGACDQVAVTCGRYGDASVVTVRAEGAEADVTYCFLLSGDLIRGLAVAA
jgi:hypothetical protein